MTDPQIGDLLQMVRELSDKEAIRSCMYRYARGIDRCDPELLRTVFWPDGTVSMGGAYNGPAYGLIDFAIPNLSRMEATQHLFGNMLIELSGDAANVETYSQCFHRMPADEERGAFDVIVAVRYLDRFAKRDGEWRIESRMMLPDWFRQYPDSGDWDVGYFGQTLVPGETAGARKPSDQMYAFFGGQTAGA